MPKKSNPPTLDKSAKKFRQFRGEPIFIEFEPPGNSPLPDEAPAWPKFFFVGGVIVALVCAWQFAPSATNELWRNLIQLFHLAGQ